MAVQEQEKDTHHFAEQTQQTAARRAEIREALVILWTQIFVAELQADTAVTVGTPSGVNRG